MAPIRQQRNYRRRQRSPSISEESNSSPSPSLTTFLVVSPFRESDTASASPRTLSDWQSKFECEADTAAFPSLPLDRGWVDTEKFAGRVLSLNDSRIGSGFGYDMLISMGWEENTGLGFSRLGIIDPIIPATNKEHMGLGFNPAAAQEAAQQEILHLQKIKREERDLKLRLKVEKAKAAEEEEMSRRFMPTVIQSNSIQHILETGGISPMMSSEPYNYKPSLFPSDQQESRSTEVGRCPHCRQQFDSKLALKSHMNARHSRLAHKLKRLVKEDRHRTRVRSASNRREKISTFRDLAPMSQDLSVYD